MHVTRGLSSEYPALFLCLAIPLIFGAGREIFATYSPHDDYYFVSKSQSLTLNGGFLAPIKEVLYPLYIRFSWVFGLSLRNFEVLCYGLSLFSLWTQINSLVNVRAVAYGTVLPLTLFGHQHFVFNHATYDSLQLILVPLTFSSAIFLYRRSANLLSLALCGSIIAAQALTRPEGFLFVLPPAASLLFIVFRSCHDLKLLRQAQRQVQG